MGAQAMLRPAFMDRDVNEGTPAANRNKAKVNEFVASQCEAPPEDLYIYEGCSYKYVPEREYFEQESKLLHHILNRYCHRDGQASPPPKFDDEFKTNFEDKLCKEFEKEESNLTILSVSIDDVDLPSLDDD